jgi:hypothetical protein
VTLNVKKVELNNTWRSVTKYHADLPPGETA